MLVISAISGDILVSDSMQSRGEVFKANTSAPDKKW